MASNGNDIVMNSPALAVIDDIIIWMDRLHDGIHRLEKIKDNIYGLQRVVAALVHDN